MKQQQWTLKDVPDLRNKTVLITGANSGLGYETSKVMAKAGAEVVMACRSLKKGEKASESIKMDYPNARLYVLELDLMSLTSIRKFADNYKLNYQKLDILINNAGIMFPPYLETEDGFESQFGTNHLGHFALTGLLFELIKKSSDSRIINVSSLAHKNGDIDFTNLLYKNGNGYSPMKAYGRSKLSNLLFSYELQRIFEEEKINAISVAAHPGVALTNLSKFVEGKWFFKLMKSLFSWFVPKADNGALPQIRAAVDPAVKGGEYYGPSGFREIKGQPVLVKSNDISHDQETARKLWEVSEKLTGISYP